MALADTSKILFDGMRHTLDVWAAKLGGESQLLYWLLRAKVDDIGSGARRAQPPKDLAGTLSSLRERTNSYWGDVRYASLEPVTQLWGTIVNAVRVAAQSSRATEGQKRLFDFDAQSLV